MQRHSWPGLPVSFLSLAACVATLPGSLRISRHGKDSFLHAKWLEKLQRDVTVILILNLIGLKGTVMYSPENDLDGCRFFFLMDEFIKHVANKRKREKSKQQIDSKARGIRRLPQPARTTGTA